MSKKSQLKLTTFLIIALFSAFKFSEYINSRDKVQAEKEQVNLISLLEKSILQQAQEPKQIHKHQLNHEQKNIQKYKQAHVVKTKFISMTKETFINYIKESLNNLPKQEDIQDLKEHEIHLMPKLLMSYGKRLGVIKENIKVNGSEFKEIAQNFYETCSKDQSTLNSIKGLCLGNLMLLKIENNQLVDLKSYPRTTIRLARTILTLKF